MTERESESESLLASAWDETKIEDNGFTARVMEALPPRRRPFSAWAYGFVFACGAAAAAWFIAPTFGTLITDGLEPIAVLSSGAALILSSIVLALAAPAALEAVS